MIREYKVSAVLYLMRLLTLNGLLEVYMRTVMCEISGSSSYALSDSPLEMAI